MKKIPLHSLVILVGPNSSGKTSWAETHFPSQEIISISALKKQLTGSSNTLDILPSIWQELYRRADVALAHGQRVVVDATNLKDKDRQTLLSIAQKYGVEAYIKPFDIDWKTLQEYAGPSADQEALRRSFSIWKNVQTQVMNVECGTVSILSGQESIVDFPQQLKTNKILAVGDVHGNFAGMQQALQCAEKQKATIVWLGDVVDYGPHNLKCLRLAYETVRDGQAFMIWGNHERKIDRWIRSDFGENFNGKLSEANLTTIREINSLNESRKRKFLAAWTALRNWSFNHMVIDKFLFTHGAATQTMWTNNERRLQGVCANMAYFGEVDTVSPTRGDGYPNRIWDWVQHIPCDHTVVVGHDWLDRVSYNVVEKANARGGKAYVTDCGSSKGGRLGSLFVDIESNEVLPYYFDS